MQIASRPFDFTSLSSSS